MGWVAWLAVLGPIGGLALGIVVGYWIGKASNAEELGAMGERIETLSAELAVAMRQTRVLAGPPLDRRESGRVLDLVVPSPQAG